MVADDVKIEICKMELADAYKLYKVLTNPTETEVSQVRFGVKEEFDLDAVLAATVPLKLRQKSGKIRVGCSWMTIKDFHTELNMREKLIKTRLIDGAEKGELVKPRSGLMRGIEMEGS